MCGICRAKIVSGGGHAPQLRAEQHETNAGYILICQAVPLSDEITVDYDA